MAMLMRLSLRAPMEAWVQFFLIGTFLLFPMSSSAKSICLTLSVGTLFFSPGFREDLMILLSSPWCKALLLFFGMTLIFCLWSPASPWQKAFAIEKYGKLLYLPILVVGFQNSTTRQLSLHAFLIALFITCVLSLLKFHGYFNFIGFNPDHVFRNHIMTSFMVAFAGYLSFLNAARSKGYACLAYSLLALFFTYQMLFINGSRTGYVVFLSLMFLLMLQIASLRQAAAGILTILVLFFSTYFISPVLKMRVDDIAQQIVGYQHNKRDTDIGLRLQFHDYAHQLFKQHPIIGNGTASFTYFFDKEKPIAFWKWKLLEPHSQYWLVACEFGLLGLAALLYFFFSLAQASWNLDRMKAIALAMILPFMLGNVSDSLLFYSGSGYFFILFMALFLGEGLEAYKKELPII